MAKTSRERHDLYLPRGIAWARNQVVASGEILVLAAGQAFVRVSRRPVQPCSVRALRLRHCPRVRRCGTPPAWVLGSSSSPYASRKERSSAPRTNRSTGPTRCTLRRRAPSCQSSGSLPTRWFAPSRTLLHLETKCSQPNADTGPAQRASPAPLAVLSYSGVPSRRARGRRRSGRP
jgi:hypothetical protein